jgi:hypothetical protein
MRADPELTRDPRELPGRPATPGPRNEAVGGRRLVTLHYTVPRLRDCRSTDLPAVALAKEGGQQLE